VSYVWLVGSAVRSPFASMGGPMPTPAKARLRHVRDEPRPLASACRSRAAAEAESLELSHMRRVASTNPKPVNQRAIWIEQPRQPPA